MFINAIKTPLMYLLSNHTSKWLGFYCILKVFLRLSHESFGELDLENQ